MGQFGKILSHKWKSDIEGQGQDQRSFDYSMHIGMSYDFGYRTKWLDAIVFEIWAKLSNI